MRRTMSLWLLVFLCICALTVFLVSVKENINTIDLLKQEYANEEARLTRLNKEKAELEDTLKMVGLPAYVENIARTQYAYMMPDEIRFFISNKEALYGYE